MVPKLPLVVLGFGECGGDNSLLAVTNAQGETMLPVFTDAGLAEAYRADQQSAIVKYTVPIRAVGDAPPAEAGVRLRPMVVSELQHLSDMLRLAGVVYGNFHVALNPAVSEPALCYEVDEFIGLFGSG